MGAVLGPALGAQISLKRARLTLFRASCVESAGQSRCFRVRLSPLIPQEGCDLIVGPTEVEDQGAILASENKPQVQSTSALDEGSYSP